MSALPFPVPTGEQVTVAVTGTFYPGPDGTFTVVGEDGKLLGQFTHFTAERGRIEVHG